MLRTGARDVRNNIDERMGMKALQEKSQTSFKVARERRSIEDTVPDFLPSVGNNWIAEVFGHHDALAIAKAFPSCKQLSIQLNVCRQACQEPVWSKQLVSISAEQLLSVPVAPYPIQFF